MRILFFVPDLNKKGGVERATISLLNELSNFKELDVTVLLLNELDPNQCFSLNPEVKVISLGIDNYKNKYFKIIRQIGVTVKTLSLDVFVTVETASLLFSFVPMFSFKNKGGKHIVWEHFNIKNNNGKRFRDYLRFLAAKTASSVITLTARDKESWIRKFSPKAKIDYIYNINPFSSKAPPYDVESKIAIAVGRYVEVKGFDRLIKAWCLFERKFNIYDWNLLIIGHGPQKEALQKLINDNNSNTISLSDGTKDIKKFYEEASFYCMTSYSEGLGMVLIEAQHFGLPCIAFDIYSGPSEVLSENSGLLVEDGDLNEYANSINKMISDAGMRKDMSINAEKESQRFDAPVIGQKWLEIFKELLK